MFLEAWYRLSGMADSREKAEQEVTGIGKSIFKHFVVLLRYDDPVNFSKHIRDLNNWIDPLQDIKLKKGRRLTSDDYFKWLYLDRDNSGLDLTKYLRRLDRDYGSLPILMDQFWIELNLEKIYQLLADQLSKNDFYSSEEILKKFDLTK